MPNLELKQEARIIVIKSGGNFGISLADIWRRLPDRIRESATIEETGVALDALVMEGRLRGEAIGDVKIYLAPEII